MSIALDAFDVWFVTGSQHLYGPEILAMVARDAAVIAAALDDAATLPVRVVTKPTLTDAGEIRALCADAGRDPRCVGLVCWMHTFSPAQMWIDGLRLLAKPFVHLHTQMSEQLPWRDIDMDFMNLHQSAHGDREFGFLATRMGIDRTVVVGHWADEEVQRRLGVWARAACAAHDWRCGTVTRFGDNMRDVAVTEGDKVEARRRLGFAVRTHGVGDLAAAVGEVSDAEVDGLVAAYLDEYDVDEALRPGGDRAGSLRDGARIEIGLRRFLDDGRTIAFTDTFEDLHGLPQLPGLAVQRLMRDGYGFGGEGDWKTAAMVRACKVMSAGTAAGVSFMEDYTYHLVPGGERVLGAHMLEVCESIAARRPRLEIHPLSIGGKDDPVRLVFDARTGTATVSALMDLGDRFRMLANVVDVVTPEEPLRSLPVARAVWKPRPDLGTSASCWIHAGGSHHTALAYEVTPEHLADFASIVGVELVVIDEHASVRDVRDRLRWNDAAYRLAAR